MTNINIKSDDFSVKQFRENSATITSVTMVGLLASQCVHDKGEGAQHTFVHGRLDKVETLSTGSVTLTFRTAKGSSVICLTQTSLDALREAIAAYETNLEGSEIANV